jgi:hypothetical protein
MRVGAFSAALGLALCIGAGPADDEIKPKTHTVSMESMRFHPDELTVACQIHVRAQGRLSLRHI